MSEIGIVAPAETPEEDSMEVDKFEPKVKITAREAQKAAKDAGMIAVSIKSLRGAAKLGKFISDQGVINLGRTYLLDNLAAAKEARDAVTDDLGGDRIKDEEILGSLHATKLGFVDAITRAATALMKSEVDQSNVDNTNAATVAMCDPDQDVRPAITVNVNQATQINPPPENKNSIPG